jgi:hypothetical protein
MEFQRLRLDERKYHTEEKLADHNATGNRQDMAQAEGSYALFNSVFKWGTIAAAITTILVVAIIASRAA